MDESLSSVIPEAEGIHKIEHALTELDTRRATLSTRLQDALVQLRTSGMAVDEQLLEDLHDFPGALRRLVLLVNAEAERCRLRVPVLPENTTLASIREAWQSNRDAWKNLQDARQRLLAVEAELQQVKDLECAIDETFAPLETVRKKANELCHSIRALADNPVNSAEDLQDQLTAYLAILRLARERTSLRMEETLSLCEQAQSVIDPKLVYAVTAGHVRLRSHASTTDGSEEATSTGDALDRAPTDTGSVSDLQDSARPNPSTGGMVRRESVPFELSHDAEPLPENLQVDEFDHSTAVSTATETSGDVLPPRDTAEVHLTVESCDISPLSSPPAMTPNFEVSVKTPPTATAAVTVEKVSMESAGKTIKRPAELPDQSGISQGKHETDGGNGELLANELGATAAAVRLEYDVRAVEGDVAAETVARSFLSASRGSRLGFANTLLLCLLRDGSVGLAYHLARYLEAQCWEPSVPASLIDAITVIPRLFSAGGVWAERVREDLAWLQAKTAAGVDHDANPRSLIDENTRMLIVAAAFRPTILAPATGAPDLLQIAHFPARLEALENIRGSLANLAKTGVLLSPSLLQGELVVERWKQDLDRLRQRSSDWLSRNRTKTVIYQATTNVWHRWLDDDAAVGRMVCRVINNDCSPQSLEDARREASNWRDNQYIDRLLHQTDRELRKVGSRRRPIEARAVTAIRERCREAAALVDEWLQHVANRPDAADDWLNAKTTECRRTLGTAIPQALQQIEEWEQQGRAHLAAVATCRLLRRMLTSLQALLVPEGGDASHEIPIHHELNHALLKIPELELEGETWAPASPGSDSVPEGIARLLAEPRGDWSEVLHKSWTTGDFETAERVLQVLESPHTLDTGSNVSGSEVETLRTQHRERLAEARCALRERTEALERTVQIARQKGLVGELERLSFVGELATVDHYKALNIRKEREVLQHVDTSLMRCQQRQIQEFQSSLAESGVERTAPAAYERILQVVESEDLITANEYLTIVNQSGELPAPVEPQPGLDFFPEFLSQASQVFFGDDRLRLRELSKRLEHRGQIGPFHVVRQLTPGEGERSGRAIRHWLHLQNGNGEARENIRGIAEFLGFRVKSIQLLNAQERDRSIRYSMEVETVNSREECTLPDFGSDSKGYYEVVCFRGQPLQDEILRETKPVHHDRTTIAFYFGPMTERRRRDLARELRSLDGRRLLVLDDILLFYLCLRRQRLLAFFNAAGQFAVAKPYRTSACLVPREMFFGRESEIEQVISPSGTNLLYGGRQLGKTALLREVERRYHRPDNEVIVICVDLLYGEQFGRGRPMDDIWTVVSSRLQEFGIVSHATRKPQTLQQEIVKWLREDQQRQIILLLDEADEFLSSDASARWPLVGRLKSIMDETSRHFKVVFAGLHNVQRTSHDINTPLAHLGRPICIGPFISGQEMRDAADLVAHPFQAMGYRFESEDLVGRILAQTNFYPSLIQLFCEQLLRRLRSVHHPRANATDVPPYVIRLDDIETAYADEELRRQILYRFDLTLRLDNRYRVIALSLALQALEDPRSVAAGFDVDELRSWACSLWREGFVESQTNDAFLAILNEMVEFGVLREVTGGRYTMRSPNVVGLMGTEEDIWSALGDATNARAEIAYEASNFRRVCNEEQRWKRSPLTAAQESQILEAERDKRDLFVVFGVPAAGLTEVPSFLQVAVDGVGAMACRVHAVEEISDTAIFERQLTDLLDRREDGLSLVLVPLGCSWTEAWLRRARSTLARRTSKRRITKVVFLAGPREAWNWCDDLLAGDREKLIKDGLIQMSLAPFTDRAVTQWKREAEFGEDNADDLQRVREATGGWWSFITELGQRCCECPHQWAALLNEYSAEVLTKGAGLSQFGLLDETMPVLRSMADYGDALSASELGELCGVDPPAVTRVIRWADLLSLVHPTHEQKWILDPFVARLLSPG